MTSFTNLTTDAAFNANINEIKSKIPSITNFASTSDVAAIENKISNVSNLVINYYNTISNYKLAITQKLVKLKRNY